MKTPKVKKRAVSLHSRAARRGASPPAKDLAVKAAAEESDYRPWMHSTQNAGVSKKKKAKPLSRQQRVRQQRALEKADANVDKLERKVADSKARAKRVQGRAKDWEDLNAEAEAGKEKVGLGAVVKGEEGEAIEGAVEEGMEGVEVLDVQEASSRAAERVSDAEPVLTPAEGGAVEETDEVT